MDKAAVFQVGIVEEVKRGERRAAGHACFCEDAQADYAGFTEPLFMDLEYIQRESVFKTRVAPGVLTFAIAEGLALQTGMFHGTGLALMHYDVRVAAPVLAGDTVHVEIEVADKRETKKPDRGIVTFRHRVVNQRGEPVMEATVTRMIKRAAA